MLAILLSDEIETENKKKILESEFNIPMTRELKEDVNIMCNLSDGIEEKGIDKGIDKGIEQAAEKLLKKHLSCEEVSNYLDLPLAKVQEIQSRICQQV